MSLRSEKYVNNNTEAHVKEPNKEHDKDHAGETSEGHGRDQGKEAHQPQGAAPRLQRPPVQAPGPQEGSKEERHQGKLVPRGLNSETMVTLEELVPLGYPQERIDETDQDQQYCRVTDQEAREAYCRSTPDIFTKPMRTEKIRRLVKPWSERDLAHLCQPCSE
jgi:hypothetical protein